MSIEFNKLLRKRCLFNDCSILFEARIVEVSPSSRYVRIQPAQGPSCWRESDHLQLIEILADQPPNLE